MIVSVQADVKKATSALTDLAKKQIPFAAAKALTQMAQKAQTELRGTLNEYFTIRNSWTAKGIAIKRAEKRDWPASYAEVGSRDPFMRMQVTGGVKTRGGHGVVIPREIRTSKAQSLPKSKWPRAQLAKTGKRAPFIRRIETGPNAGSEAIFQMMPRKTEGLRMLYLFKRQVKLKARWPIDRLVSKSTEGTFEPTFSKAMLDAIANAKPVPNKA